LKWQADDVNTYAIACLPGPKEFKTVILVVDCVQSEVAKVVESQHSLERQLELIETHQQEVISLRSYIFSCLGVPCFESHELFVGGEMSYFSFLCVIIGQIEKSLESMEDEAERIYRDERPSLVEDEAAATRDMM
jgi:nuclear pore complex protein Nup62